MSDTIGSLNRRIKVKAAAPVKDDASGLSSDRYIVRYMTWASIKPVSSKLQLLQGNNILQNVFDVTIRATPERELTTKDIIEYKSKDHVVLSVEQEYEGKLNYYKILMQRNG